MDRHPVRLLTRTDIERVLDIRSCITAVSDSFRWRAEGRASPSGVLGVHVAGGGFHAKAAMLELSRPYFVAKVNANFPSNPASRNLPTIQGVLVLFDATDGVPLAVMDSVAITTLRTAAASAVAASHLARTDAGVAAFVGCGVQARAHLAALLEVRPIERAVAFDLDRSKAEVFATEMSALHTLRVDIAGDLAAAVRSSSMVVTSTSATKAYLGVRHVALGTFVAAVGADNEHKHEIEPALMRAAAVVVDDLDQCATIGDLHHAIALGVLTRDDVRATLGEVIAGLKPGRGDDDEIVVFDSTGVAIEDVAAAALAYERAISEGSGLTVRLAD
jgi:ornithine cyclodeaminase/alanine dehydrogenase-like protein (mu-crystallin family)